MVLEKGRNINKNDTAILSDGITLNSSTSTKIADTNTSRIYFSITNESNKGIWLKLQPAATDNDSKGEFLPSKSKWTMPTDNIYTGEVSAISESGTPSVYTTEY